MAFQVKSGTVWSPAVANGNLRLKWGGSSWTAPAYVYHKVGDVGGGFWRDTGYRGRPNPPQNLSIYGWDFSSVAVKWDPPALGGGPVVAYDIMMTNSNANPIAYAWGVGGSPWGWFSVSQDSVVAFFIRSVGVGGQVSDWVEGPGIGDGRLWSRARIGHTEDGYYADEQRIREWASGQASGSRRQNGYYECWAPNSNFVVQSLHWRNLRIASGGIVAPAENEYGSKTLYWVVNSAGQSPITDYHGVIYSGHNANWWISNGVRATGWFGLWVEGGGWSTWDDVPYLCFADAVWVQGYEEYYVSVYRKTRDYRGNDYW